MTWATLADCLDAAVTVRAEELEAAGGWVESILAQIGIDPSEVPAPQPKLMAAQTAQALAMACYRLGSQARGNESPLIEKGDRYSRVADRLVSVLSRRALGLTASVEGSRFGVASITIGRG